MVGRLVQYGISLVIIGCQLAVFGQGRQEDYDSANSYYSRYGNKVLNNPTNFTWLEDGQQFWYTLDDGTGAKYVLQHVNGSRRPLFDHQLLIDKMSALLGMSITSSKLSLIRLRVEKDNLLKFEAYDKEMVFDTKRGQLTVQEDIKRSQERKWNFEGGFRNEQRADKAKSPDGKKEAYIHNYNIFVRTSDEQSGKQLTTDGTAARYYSSDIEWSPDGEKLLTSLLTTVKVGKVPLIESSPTDQLQPKLFDRDYVKPGDSIPQRQPILFDLAQQVQYKVDMQLIPDQYFVSNFRWRDDSKSLIFDYNKRGHQEYRIMEINALTGQVRTIVKEMSKTFVNYYGKTYRYEVDGDKELIWMSERDGWTHLYLYDAVIGQVKNQITKGEWVVRKVIDVNASKREIIFEGSGMVAGQDPYFIQYYKINFDGTGLLALTDENATHRAVFSPDHSYFIDTYSRIDQAPKSVLRSAKDGTVVQSLVDADITGLLVAGWKPMESFVAKGRDGVTDIWGIIVRPKDFDPAKKYPVIEYIYAGPHDSFVPKQFTVLTGGGMAELAELGFIVVQIDGMGTANRSKAFHDVCWQNLKDAGFPDRIAWMKSAAQHYPYMDLDRVGIYGTSAGGQNAAGAVLFHPDFYKVSVASCGCHDNRMDKIWWNEQWMGYPIGAHYAASSNIVHASNLKGKLMLLVGELDSNVDPSSTYQFVNALIKAGKPHEFILLPGLDHTSGGAYGEHKRRDFFVKHLLGVDPPTWK